MEKKKVGFASGVGFILAAAGSAVGLGNLWGFPYKTSQNGGAAFVLIYIACVLLIGFVTMLSEIYLGRRAQANPMTAYKMIHKNLGWCGLVAIVIPAFIICYYSVLGGWTRSTRSTPSAATPASSARSPSTRARSSSTPRSSSC